MRVPHTHGEDAPIAVDILDGQALHGRLIVGIGARGGADVPGPVGQREFRAIGVEPGHQVNGARVQQMRGLRIGAPVADQVVKVVKAGGAGGELGRVDVAVQPECGLVDIGAGGRVGEDHGPDVPPLMALADGAHRHQVGPGRHVGHQQRRECLVAEEFVEAGRGQCGGHGHPWTVGVTRRLCRGSPSVAVGLNAKARALPSPHQGQHVVHA